MSGRFLPAVALVAGTLVGCDTGDARKDKSPGAVDVEEIRAAALAAALKEQKGKVVVVDCWATWCAPCVKKFPHLVEMHKKYADKGLVCVSLSMDKSGPSDGYSKDKVLAFLKDKGAAFPNFILAEPDKDEKAVQKLLGDFAGIPYMTVFDRSGRRVWASDERPKLSDEQLEKKIEALLAEKE